MGNVDLKDMDCPSPQKGGWVTRILSAVLLLLSVLTLAACHEADRMLGPPADPVVTQGVAGLVLFWQGDFMPVLGPGTPTGTKRPVVRELLVYELTNLADVTSAGDAFYSAISTRRVASTLSGADGRFAVQLPVGRFSLFVREQSMFYANGGDGQGFIYPIDVVADTVTEVQFDITYLAYF